MTWVAVRATGAGLLIAAALPPWGWWPLALVGLAIWFVLIDQANAGTRFRRSFLVGLAWSAPATLWIVDLTAPGWPATVFAFSLLAGLAGLATPPCGALRRWAFPAAIILTELIRWNYPFGGTPIATYAMTGVATPFAMAARLFGSPFLAFLVVMAGVATADAWRRQWKAVGGAIAVLVAATVGGHWAGSAVEPVGSIEVAVVQGGGPQNTRADFCETRSVFERHMAASETIDRGVDLILWPEDVVHASADNARTPDRCDEPLLGRTEAFSRLSQLAAATGAVVISGWFQVADDGLANTNFALAQSPDGTITDRYDKVRLVPFGEFVPFRSLIERFSRDLPRRDVRPGTGDAVLETGVGPLGIVISWEIFFDHRARDAIGNGGQVLLNPTNGSSYWLTIVQSQQIASSQLRAIETDRWVLQAAPTGFSAVVSPTGEVLQRTGVSEQRVLYHTIERRTGRTLAVAWGLWPVLVGVLAILGAVVGRVVFQASLKRSF